MKLGPTLQKVKDNNPGSKLTEAGVTNADGQLIMAHNATKDEIDLYNGKPKKKAVVKEEKPAPAPKKKKKGILDSLLG